MPNYLIDELRNKSFAILFKFIIFQAHPELLDGYSRVNDRKFTHKHDPVDFLTLANL